MTLAQRLFKPADSPRSWRGKKSWGAIKGTPNMAPSAQTGAKGAFPGSVVSLWPVADPSPQNNPSLLAPVYSERGVTMDSMAANVGRMKYGGLGEFNVGANSIPDTPWFKLKKEVRPANEKTGIVTATPQGTSPTWQIPTADMPAAKLPIPAGGDWGGLPSPSPLTNNRIVKVVAGPAKKTVVKPVSTRNQLFANLFKRRKA